MPRVPFDQFDAGPKFPDLTELRRRFADLKYKKDSGADVPQKDLESLRMLVRVLPRRDNAEARVLEEEINGVFGSDDET